MQDALTALRQENERLKRRVQALSDKLMAIHLIIGDTAEMDVRLKLPVHSNDNIEDGIYLQKDSNDKSLVGINSPIYSNDEIKDGMATGIGANDKTNIGINLPIYANDKSMVGMIGVNDAPLQNNIGIKPVKEATLELLLRKNMAKSSDAGISNTAKILIQLHSGTQQSYQSLRKVTGLSAGGIAKRMMALRKYGFIVKTGFQLYALTPKSMLMMDAAQQ